MQTIVSTVWLIISHLKLSTTKFSRQIVDGRNVTACFCLFFNLSYLFYTYSNDSFQSPWKNEFERFLYRMIASWSFLKKFVKIFKHWHPPQIFVLLDYFLFQFNFNLLNFNHWLHTTVLKKCNIELDRPCRPSQLFLNK